MSWIALRITPETNREGVIAALFESGSQGVQEDGADVITHFPPGARIDDIRNAVIDADPRAEIAMTEAPDTDYSHGRASVGAHEVGELIIAPPWLAACFDATKTVVVDPAMAFGTGEHPTTRSAMRLMQGVIRPGDVVADLGAGSAVLSIAAVKLGASRVAAVEIDRDAIGNAEENIHANCVADRVEVIEGDAAIILPLLAPVRVVIANISSAIVSLLPVIHSSMANGGRAILAGLLVEERQKMVSALNAGGWAIQREDAEDSWWSVEVAPVQ
ncbi:MAG TPA: 50S ribosomal protein L11 methyltransferase [Gemmatimonadaceae bacterium]|nr:50S ribosomal protein L11 methyltransferase [Gemmatimonadaceae bacterium]